MSAPAPATERAQQPAAGKVMSRGRVRPTAAFSRVEERVRTAWSSTGLGGSHTLAYGVDTDQRAWQDTRRQQAALTRARRERGHWRKSTLVGVPIDLEPLRRTGLS
jgi:hypothetical protein